MLLKAICAVLIVFAVLGAWVLVQHLARRFAARHPELGPAREEGEGCGQHCSGAGNCLMRRIGLCHGTRRHPEPFD
jgi:hypothetical protein